MPRFLLSLGLLVISLVLSGGPLWFDPVRKILPDGKQIDLFVSGDEFFNWLHDRNGYPVGEGDDGYYYYLIQKGDSFNMTSARVDLPGSGSLKGLSQVVVPEWVAERRAEWNKEMEILQSGKGKGTGSKSSGLLNNMVIYIRFNGEPEFTIKRTTYESRLNSPGGPSVRHYFSEASYSKLDIISHHLPGGVTSEICYTDQYPREYYRPYNESTNLYGYKTSADRTTREHNLLANAAAWFNSGYTLPEGVDFDSDNDGEIDNVCFIVKGSADGWNELLWPHRWSLYSVTAKISGMRIMDYTFQLENVGVTTLSHEMFHVLGAPDLYHYNNSDKPVGPWDLMGSGGGHPGAWMKYRYGKWLKNIPEITASGAYTIKPLTDSARSAYILRSPYRDDQFIVVEFRKKGGLYEKNLPASGLIITRIDTRYRGNSNGPPDEVYVYRKNGAYMLPGDINSAEFSTSSGRTIFTDNSNPNAFFQEGGITGLKITGITSFTDSMTFTVDMDKPVELTASPVEDSQIYLTWKGVWEREYLVAVSRKDEKLSPMPGKIYREGDTIGSSGKVVQVKPQKYLYHNDLESDEQFYYSVFTVTGKNPVSFSEAVRVDTRTGIYIIPRLPYSENFDGMTDLLPRGWKSPEGRSGWEYTATDPWSFPNTLIMKTSGDGSNQLFLPGLSLEASKTYLITYRYRNADPFTRESLFLRSSLSRNGTGTEKIQILSSTDFTYRDYVIQKKTFSVISTNVFYPVFETVPGGTGIMIDDLKIEQVPSGTTDHLLPAEFYPNPTTGIITIPADSYTEISVFRSDGKKVYTTSVESMQEIDLSFLGKGIFVLKFTVKGKVTTGKLIIL